MSLDICLFISDQHSYSIQGNTGNPIIRTPNLDYLASQGVSFHNTYTSCPLCVPARMSMLSGKLASQINVMGNGSILDSSRPTFLHSLNAAGYETVLCGRMHFVGPDQRHGYSKRIAGDITPIYTNRPEIALKKERGVHMNTLTGGANSVSIIGAGNSPSLEYDRYVIKNALDYLSHNHEKPQFITVGTYSPHHPYVTPRELFDYYYEKLDGESGSKSLPSFYSNLFQDTDPKVVRAVRAAYYGMVEFTDNEIGLVYNAFQAYLERVGREGIFIYVSDHGDHIGSRGLYGKQTFYEESSHIPLIFTGSGILKGKKVMGATSIMDIGPTLCSLVAAPLLTDYDGKSLVLEITTNYVDKERCVISELGGTLNKNGDVQYAQMVKKGRLKYVHYKGLDEDAVYNTDINETDNLITSYPDFVEKAKALLSEKCATVDEIEKNAQRNASYLAITSKCDFDSEERWRCPKSAREYPEKMVSSAITPKEVLFY